MVFERFMRLLAPLVVLLSLPVLGSAQTGRSPEELAKALQERYQSVRDFTADFVQTYRGGVLRTETRERGTVTVKKPGLMRWIYTNPERKEFVSDGLKMYSYIPEDRQVVVSNVPTDSEAPTPVLFLAGKGNLVRDFTASQAESPVAGSIAVKLTPRRKEPEYEYLIVAVDPATLQIRALTTRDRQGGESTLRFENLKENKGISDKDFAFRIPRGVDVITNGQRN
ncbi:MAG TPA: outer membrane lipoprotein chaperone LolA [Vicinamibacterales bacterium]|nr:outer membrane lipoprotein chaperone LolA [Vicinamibacterales bacterium]